MNISDVRIAVIGLGYVGLPIAVEFSRKFSVVGFDISSDRVSRLQDGVDDTREVDSSVLKSLPGLTFTDVKEDISDCNTFVVTVPTPVDADHRPDLSPLIKASEMIGSLIKPGAIVIYESTVYPGATEEVCIPAIERVSGLRLNEDFYAGYSPERINPGDKTRPVSKIVKVTSGSTVEAAKFVDLLYSAIIEAGTFKAKSIKVAEAAKVIENTQRDVNIALINELSMVFDAMGINTGDVLDAAATKWNFIRLQPGLVGGHCISVDPYYLVHKSIAMGYIPDIIRTSREINAAMPKFLASKLVKEMIRRGQKINGAKVLVLGLSFKEDCPDTRNTKVVDLVAELADYGLIVEVYDPVVDPDKVGLEFDIKLLSVIPETNYDALVFAVGHSIFKDSFASIIESAGPKATILDMKRVLGDSKFNQICF